MDGTNKCIDCKDRHIGCHSTCEIYIKWKQEYNEKKEIELSYKRNKNYGYYHK